MRFFIVLTVIALTASVAFGQATLPGAGSSAPASSSSTPAGASLSPLPYVDTSNVQVQWTTSVPIGIQSSSTNSPTFTRPTFAVQSSGSVTVDADQTSIRCSIRVEQYLNKNSPAGSSASSGTSSAGSSDMMSSMAGVAPVAPIDSTVIYPPIGTSGGTTDSGYTQAQINALVASVQNSLSTQANDLIGYLKSSSMSSYVSKVSTDSVNLSPIYKTNQNNGNSVLTGYSGVYRVSFRVSIASNQTSMILSALPDHSVTSIDSVSFTASDDTFNRAQQLAIESATQNALQQLQATINAVNQLTSSGSATPTMSIASIEITNVSSQNTVSGDMSGYGEGYQNAASPTASAAYAPLPITGGTTQASATVKVTVFF